ncbi:MAG: serine kinase, partial [Brevundimonas sp.]
MSAPMQPIHATAVACRTAAGWRGVLIQGPSGVGKSDLALRLIGQGWRLIADDWTHLWASDGALYAATPAVIAGRIEVRGLGIVAAPLWP